MPPRKKRTPAKEATADEATPIETAVEATPEEGFEFDCPREYLSAVRAVIREEKIEADPETYNAIEEKRSNAHERIAELRKEIETYEEVLRDCEFEDGNAYSFSNEEVKERVCADIGKNATNPIAISLLTNALLLINEREVKRGGKKVSAVPSGNKGGGKLKRGCPFGCGFNRKTADGLRSHLGVSTGEINTDNCPRNPIGKASLSKYRSQKTINGEEITREYLIKYVEDSIIRE